MDVETRASQVIPRRTLAKGAMWAVPAIALAAAAPAYAASMCYTTQVCLFFYGQGGGNTQTNNIYFSFGGGGSDVNIQAGTQFFYSFTITNPERAAAGKQVAGNPVVPVGTTSPTGIYSWSVGAMSRTADLMTYSFSATLTFLKDAVIARDVPCPGVTGIGSVGLNWDTASNNLGMTNTVKVTMSASNALAGSCQNTSSLTWRVAERRTNTLDPVSYYSEQQVAHTYIAKAGSQTCWPAVRFIGDSLSTTAANLPCGETSPLNHNTINSTSVFIRPTSMCYSKFIALGDQQNVTPPCP